MALGSAAVLQNSAEAAACSYQQSDGGRRRQAFIGKFQDGVPAETSHRPESNES